MIDVAKLVYRVVAVSPEGEQIDLTDVTSALGWSEGERELAAKITMKLANVLHKDKYVSDLVRPFTPIFIYADIGEGFVEVIRGTVQRWSLTESNGEKTLNIEAADEVQALRHNEDFFYFTASHSSTAIITEIFNKWGVPYELKINDVKHDKKVYRKKNLADMVADVLKDLKEKDGGVFFMRAKEGIIQIIPRGTNETVFHLDIDDNIVRVNESFDVTSIVTRVRVIGKQDKEGHQSVESTIDGNLELGVRQVIYERGDKVSLEEAEKAAKKILAEQGEVKRNTSIDSPDVPVMRKGDRIRIHSSAGEGYFFVKSIRHSAPTMRMTLELDEDKETNKAQGNEFNTDDRDESGSSNPD